MIPEDGRVVALIDMDCFYVQVEERENPQNKGKPACVVQYKKWKGGGIISVNYEARAQGVTKQMRGDEAKEKCPDCILYRVPEQRGKADLTRYRDGGKEVIDVMCSFGVCVERASIDEAYIDMTSVINQMFTESLGAINPDDLPNTHVVGWGNEEGDPRGVNSWLKSLSEEEYNENNWKLAQAAILCEKMRAAVYEKTGFRCSAGVSTNKMLAKLACGINKPNKQTVLPMKSVPEFFKSFPLKKVRHLGGKLGLQLKEELQCTTMSDIANIPEKVLQEHFDSKTGTWLYWYSRGVDHEVVSSRRLPKSIGCNKNFTGLSALDTREKILHWLEELCAEVAERLEKDRETNNRTAKLLTLTVRLEGDIRPYSYTRSLPLPSSYEKHLMAKSCLSIMNKENTSKQPNIWSPVVTCLGVSASKFVDQTGSNSKIDRYFTTAKSTPFEKEVKQKDKSVENETNPSTHDVNYDGSDPEDEVEELETDGLHSSLKESGQQFPVAPKDTLSYLDRIEECNTEAYELHKDPASVGQETNINSKKKGFFASRNLKKDDVPVIDEVEPTPHQPAAQSLSSSFSVDELFPDLEQVDMETVALLPIHMRREILQKIENANRNSANGSTIRNENLTICEKCNKPLLKEELEEHKDFHLAFDLQNALSSQPSSSNASLLTKVKSHPRESTEKKSSKRTLKGPKKTNMNSKRSRTIDSFFNNP